MGRGVWRTRKWLKKFMSGKKNKEEGRVDGGERIPATPARVPATSTEKRRWSFRRAAAPTDMSSPDVMKAASGGASDGEVEQKNHAVAGAEDVAVAKEAAAAAVKIQSFFRAYLARKALRALKGLVKLQALVRGHLVRKQATATLRCMQALVAVQSRIRAQRVKMLEETSAVSYNQTLARRSPMHPRLQDERALTEENVKIVEMDRRSSYSVSRSSERRYGRYSEYRDASPKMELLHHYSPATSEVNPKVNTVHYDEFSFNNNTTQSSPQHVSSDYPFFPNYMANTESSRAKSRSQSAPRQRVPDTGDRPASRRRPSTEERPGIPKGVRMLRSSSHVGSAIIGGFQYPWSSTIKLDKSNTSLKDSECGSNSTVTTIANYSRSILDHEAQRNRYH